MRVSNDKPLPNLNNVKNKHNDDDDEGSLEDYKPLPHDKTFDPY